MKNKKHSKQNTQQTRTVQTADIESSDLLGVAGKSDSGSELLSRPEQLSGKTKTVSDSKSDSESTKTSATTIRPYVNFAERDFNRNLPTPKVLEILRRWMPRQYELAEVVGGKPDSGWIWITFPEQPLERVRAELSQLGFHWNNVRKCWQHPCGKTLPRGEQEPREKYAIYKPAQLAA